METLNAFGLKPVETERLDIMWANAEPEEYFVLGRVRTHKDWFRRKI